MHKLKILTIDDLIKFCKENNFTRFSSKESGYALYVQVPCEKFELEDNDDPITLYANVRLMHTGKNNNLSTLTEKAAKNCLSKIAYKPVLAAFTDINGERDFTYHAMEINDDGSRTYIEKQVGCFTSDKPYMEQDPDNSDRFYVYAKVAIPREYTDTADIIERKGGTNVSAELAVNDISYSKEDGLLLNDVEVMAVTLLGVDPETGEIVRPGMQNAYLQIEDFSAENNSVINKSQLKEEIIAEVLSRLDYKQAENSAENLKEGGNQEMDKFNELLAKYDKKIEDVTFDYENMTDEEFEVAFASAFETAEDSDDSSSEDTNFAEDEDSVVKTEDAEDTEDETSDATVVDETFGDDDPEPDNGDESTDDETQSVSTIEDEDSTGTVKFENSLEYSVTIDGVTKTFAVSLGEKISAIEILVNNTYSESDNAYYSVDVYEEPSKYCIMHDWWNNRHYKQEYSVKKDIYSLKGDRVRVTQQFLTDEQVAELDKMRNNYSSIESELNQYKAKELHAAREEVLASEDYAVLKNDKDFKELKENMDNFSVEELANKADLIFAKFMKASSHKNFAATKGNTSHTVFMNSDSDDVTETKLPYGGLFKNFKTKK